MQHVEYSSIGHWMGGDHMEQVAFATSLKPELNQGIVF
jgi:hypothetical protein